MEFLFTMHTIFSRPESIDVAQEELSLKLGLLLDKLFLLGLQGSTHGTDLAPDYRQFQLNLR